MENQRLNRILCLDYGDRRIGIAISDPMKIIAKPYTIIDRKKIIDYYAKIIEIVSDNQISKILVGLPLTLKGGISNQTEVVLEFINNLKLKLNIPILTIDERLTSIAAKKALFAQTIKTKNNKGLIDQTAAAIMLQEYLDSL